jgi:hypothetical protein
VIFIVWIWEASFKSLLTYTTFVCDFREEIEPIGSGPLVNLDGDAMVSTNIAGVNNMYSITTADIQQLRDLKEDTEL